MPTSTASTNNTLEPPDGYTLPHTAAWFVGGGIVTALFSGSLAALTSRAELSEVLLVGMLVPSFTWVVQLTASAIWLRDDRRLLYWGALGRVCMAGSVALLPAAVINLSVTDAPRWLSAANVIASVSLMAVMLFRLAAKHRIGWGWPASWCATIATNMAIFMAVSWRWWS